MREPMIYVVEASQTRVNGLVPGDSFTQIWKGGRSFTSLALSTARRDTQGRMPPHTYTVL